MTAHETPREEEPMSDTGLAEERALVDPVAVGPCEPGANGHDEPAAAAAIVEAPPLDGGAGTPEPATSLSSADASLLALIDRLSSVLERGDLGELEVSSGGTTIILRSPSAIAAPVAVASAPTVEAPAGGTASALADAPAEVPAPVAARPSVKAPLTGIYYSAPSPGATPYVAVGDHVSVGQIIGLIEAMKLFNEIKSDLAGRVVKITAENGKLVRAKQPLIEVEPL
jgi:acetyl-CoA carboxylase biotin carboxyl carrier protein